MQEPICIRCGTQPVANRPNAKICELCFLEAMAELFDQDELREKLAAYSHDSAWSGWMNYQFSKGEFNEDGSWTMPAWAVERWQRQASTPYADLPESEKTSDRAEADKILAILDGE